MYRLHTLQVYRQHTLEVYTNCKCNGNTHCMCNGKTHCKYINKHTLHVYRHTAYHRNKELCAAANTGNNTRTYTKKIKERMARRSGSED